MSYAVLDKDTIKNYILPYLPQAKRGYSTKSCMIEIVNAILYKLKTGCHWKMLPVNHLFADVVLGWNAVYHHFRKWSKGGHWKEMWINLLKDNRAYVDLSMSHTDGSHARCTRGGELSAYQGRKKCRTTNSIYFTDRQGLPLAMSFPKKGNLNDIHQIEESMTEIFDTLIQAEIRVDGLFNNADGGFDAASFRNVCEKYGVMVNVAENPKFNHDDVTFAFDEKMYKERFVIERSNAWMDAYRSLLMCHDVTASSWIGWNYLCFAIIFLKKIHK